MIRSISRRIRRPWGLPPRDGEYLRLLAEIPSDRGSEEPPVSRVLGALPTTHLDEIAIPGLVRDLKRVEQAGRLDWCGGRIRC